MTGTALMVAIENRNVACAWAPRFKPWFCVFKVFNDPGALMFVFLRPVDSYTKKDRIIIYLTWFVI